MTTLVDSDVVDVAASHTKSSILHHAVTFSGGSSVQRPEPVRARTRHRALERHGQHQARHRV
ncbi:MAG: hypothetical protein ACLSAH_09750 [Bilophila wadsworthia]